MLKRIHIIILLGTLSVLRLSGQDADYHFYENIPLGPYASIATCFLQDPQGMMWIGSDRGLFSYDGYSNHAHFAYGGRDNIRIHCLAMADSSRFYIGTGTGILVYNFLTDTYEDFDPDFHCDTRALLMRDGTLWIGSTDGLYTYRPDTGELEDASDGLPHRTVYSLAQTSDGNLYIGTYDGCCRLNPDSGKYEIIPLPSAAGKSNVFVNSLLADAAGNCIWIGTEGCLFKHNPTNCRTDRIEALRDNSVKTLVLDSDGRLLAGTDDGLYVLQENEPAIYEIHDSRDPNSLSNNIIWAIFTDREDNVWLGTNRGISLVKRNNVLRHIHISLITGTGEGNLFRSILKDSHGEYWFGGTNGIIHLNSSGIHDLSSAKENVTWYKMGDKDHPISHNVVHKIYEDREGDIWLTTDGGVNRYDRSTRQFTAYNVTDSTGRYNANWTYSLFEDENGRMWITTFMGGIFIVDRQRLINSAGRTCIADRNITTDDGLPGMFVNSLIPDLNGNVWGLLYDSRDCIVKIDTKTYTVSTPLAGVLLDSPNPDHILRATDGSIWIAMRGTIMRFDPKDGSHKLTSLNSSGRCEILAMAEAGDRIWLSTSDGLWSIDLGTLEMLRHYFSDQQFNAMFYDSSDDKFYFGGSDGIIVSSPSALSKPIPTTPLILSALYVNGTIYATPQSIRYTDHVRLSHNQNSLTLELTDLPYSAEERSRIIYKLESDKDWNTLPPGTNIITYNNLRYGRYRLLACKPDADGRPSGDIFSFAIRIRPPWYSTVLAKTIYVLLFIALIVWTVNFVQVRRKYHLEQLEKKQIMEQSQAAKQDFDRQLLEAKARILALTPAEKREGASYDEKFLANVLAIIDEHISDPHLNVSLLCDLSGTNPKQMYRKMRKITGLSPVEYIKSVRIKIAAELLKQRKASVSEVMYMVGFSNSSYFSKVFTAEFGMTPKRFMESF